MSPLFTHPGARIESEGFMDYMEQARQEALLGRGLTYPNPMVGAVIVRDDRIVGRGFHSGGPHAEVVALTEAGEAARGATLYCTLEPCRHVGRTGPCTNAIVEAGISKVIYAVEDPTSLAGGGAAILKSAGIDVSFSPNQRVAFDNRAWLHKARNEKVYVIAKSAMTLDGRIAAFDGSSKWITGEESRADVAGLRSQVDAIVTGTGTVLKDDPQLTVRGIEGAVQPERIVVGSRTIPANHQIHSNHGFTQVDSPKAVLQLAEVNGYNALLVEAGSGLLTAFLAEDLIDEWWIYIAPLALGDGQRVIDSLNVATLADARKFSFVSTSIVGTDVRMIVKRGSNVHGNR